MKKFFAVGLVIAMLMTLCACGSESNTTHIQSDDGRKLSFIAEFYDNYGEQWLSIEGTEFNISPNKVKEYYYDDEGDWTYHWTLSSIVSIDIDGNNIESCGDTVIFYDTSLVKYDVEIPEEVILSQGNEASISTPNDLRPSDGWTLNWWWDSEDLENKDVGSKIVVIKSQLGDPICMFMGDEVSWDVSRNLPKTTEVCIDGKMIYIHRSNFNVIDTEVFNGGY